MPKNDGDAVPVESLSDHRSSQTVMGMLTVVRDELRQSVVRDETEHKRLSDRLDKVTDKLGEVAEQTSAANAKLELIGEDVKDQKKAMAHQKKVTVETAALVERTTIEDSADARRNHRERNLKLVAIVASALGTGGIIVTLGMALISKC